MEPEPVTQLDPYVVFFRLCSAALAATESIFLKRKGEERDYEGQIIVRGI